MSTERIATALERIAAALERLATQPSGTLPARRGTQRKRSSVQACDASEVDEVTRARARKTLERLGLL